MVFTGTSGIASNTKYSDESDSRNSVMFVTGQPGVKKWLLDMFTDENLPLHNDFVVIPDAVTRERAVEYAREKRPKLVLFFETTVGTLSLSETLYEIRLSGARVIYISTQRTMGDLVLEALVGYGIYDLILDESVTIQTMMVYIYNPRKFEDAAGFARKVIVPDSGFGVKNFEIPNLADIRRFSKHFEDDYLVDPAARAVQGLGNRVMDDTAHQSVGQRIFTPGQQTEQPQARQPQQVQNPNYVKPKFGFIPQAPIESGQLQPGQFGYGDIPEDI